MPLTQEFFCSLVILRKLYSQTNVNQRSGVALFGQAHEDFTLIKSIGRLLIAGSFTMRLNDHMKLCYFFCSQIFTLKIVLSKNVKKELTSDLVE